MSRVKFFEKLLDDVAIEWKSVSEIFDIKNGYTPSKLNNEYWADGSINWFRMDDIRENGNILQESIRKISSSAVKAGKLFPENSIIISTSATIGEHALIKVPHLANQRFTSLSIKSKYNNIFDIKFIFYYCYLLAEWCKKNTTVSSFASVDMEGFRKFSFPIPCPDNPQKSLEIQAEIVRILDAMTAHTAELTAELTARKKQYNYYRDNLLIFEDGEVDWKTLGEVTYINTGSKPEEICDKSTDFYYINAGTTRSGYSEESNCEGDTVTTPSRGQGGIGFVGYQKNPFWLGPLCYKIRSSDENRLINKYIYYYLQSNSKLIIELKKEGGVPAVNKSDLAKLNFPIPSIAKQKYIVSTLDKFDALTASITEGLPCEIELREKQYAYYRDLLLSFPQAQAA